MIFTPYLHPIKYYLRTFVSSPIQANKDLFFDLKKDFQASKVSNKKKIIWINGIPKSGTSLISSILDLLGYVEGNRSLLRNFDPTKIKHPHEICDGHFKYFPKNKFTYVKTHSHHKARFINIAKKYNATNIVTLRDIRPMMLSRYWHIMSDEKHWQHNIIKNLNFEKGLKKSLIYGYSYKNLTPIEYYQSWIIDWIKNKNDANLILWFEDYKLNPLDYIANINKCINCNSEPYLIEKVF